VSSPREGGSEIGRLLAKGRAITTGRRGQDVSELALEGDPLAPGPRAKLLHDRVVDVSDHHLRHAVLLA
jgi:hypothetical protein